MNNSLEPESQYKRFIVFFLVAMLILALLQLIPTSQNQESYADDGAYIWVHHIETDEIFAYHSNGTYITHWNISDGTPKGVYGKYIALYKKGC